MLDPVVPAARLLPAVFGNDFRHARGEAALNQGVGRLHRDAHGVVVDLLNRLEASQKLNRSGAARGSVGEEAFGAEGEDHVVGRKVRAVLELDALTELEFDGFRRNARPGNRETRLKFARLLIGVDERFEDRERNALERIVVLALRLDDGRQLRHGHDHVLSARPGLRGKEARGNDGTGEDRRVRFGELGHGGFLENGVSGDIKTGSGFEERCLDTKGRPLFFPPAIKVCFKLCDVSMTGASAKRRTHPDDSPVITRNGSGISLNFPLFS